MEALVAICLTALLGWIGYIVKGLIEYYLKRKEERYELKREALKKILIAHRELNFENYPSPITKNLSDASIEFLLWAGDDVINNYIIYINKRLNYSNNILEHEESFGQMILEFRKEIGNKNKGNIITAKGIIDIFRAGQGTPIK